MPHKQGQKPQLPQPTAVKIIIRLLPPNLTPLAFYETVNKFIHNQESVFDFKYFVQGEYSANPFELPTYSRAYLKFRKPEALGAFLSKVAANQGEFVFSDDKESDLVPNIQVCDFDGMTNLPCSEQDTWESVQWVKPNKLNGTIQKDSLFTKFIKIRDGEIENDGEPFFATDKKFVPFTQLLKEPLQVNQPESKEKSKKSKSAKKSSKKSEEKEKKSSEAKKEKARADAQKKRDARKEKSKSESDLKKEMKKEASETKEQPKSADNTRSIYINTDRPSQTTHKSKSKESEAKKAKKSKGKKQSSRNKERALKSSEHSNGNESKNEAESSRKESSKSTTAKQEVLKSSETSSSNAAPEELKIKKGSLKLKDSLENSTPGPSSEQAQETDKQKSKSLRLSKSKSKSRSGGAGKAKPEKGSKTYAEVKDLENERKLKSNSFRPLKKLSSKKTGSKKPDTEKNSAPQDKHTASSSTNLETKPSPFGSGKPMILKRNKPLTDDDSKPKVVLRNKG